MESTILVVEDDPELQEVLTLNLQNAGYRVLRASNIRQAEALVSTTLPQLILLDWMLPDTPGLTFARKLRAAFPHVPVGAASLSDRTLPYLFPTASEASFVSGAGVGLADGDELDGVTVELASFAGLEGDFAACAVGAAGGDGDGDEDHAEVHDHAAVGSTDEGPGR